jgi:hypothetical protein
MGGEVDDSSELGMKVGAYMAKAKLSKGFEFFGEHLPLQERRRGRR